MRLNPIAFNKHIAGIGQDFLWRRASLCPCRNIDGGSGAATRGCKICGGKTGYFWGDPIAATAGVASQSVVKKFAQFGQWEQGDAVFSIPEDSPMYEVARFDRMLMKNSLDGFALPLVRGDNDRITLIAVQKFTRVYWIDGAGTAIVEGGLPEIDGAGVLTWPNGSAPPEGKQYTIEGTRYVEYFMFEALSSDRGEHHGARLPKRVQARRFDLFGR